MRRGACTIEVEYDPDVNAAVLRFAAFPKGHDFVDVPIVVQGSMVGVVTFAGSGQLVQIDLLAARTQIAALLPDE